MALAEEIFFFVGVFAASAGFIGWWKHQKRAKPNEPPSIPSLPFIGSLLYILKDLNNVSEFFRKSSEHLGPIFTFMAGSRKILVLNSKDTIDDAYVNNLSAFSGRRGAYIDTLANPNQKGLVFKSTDAEWKKYHHLCHSILKEFGFGIKSRMEERVLIEVEAMVDCIRQKNGETFNPRNVIAMVATNVINNILFGQRREYEKGLGELYIQAEQFFEALDLSLDLNSANRFFPQFRHKIVVYKKSQSVISNIIQQEIERCKNSEVDDCFVKIYLEKEGTGLDEEQLQWTIRDLIVAGSGTTISTLEWSLVALANYPAVQETLRKDLDAVVPRSRFPTMRDQQDLPFAEATILELLRWKTLAPLALPRITLRDAKLNGYFIPSGTWVLANLYAAHMDPKMWADPIEFRPERFLDEENKVFGRDRIIPFSLGRRSCLGEGLARTEIFLVVTAIVQNFIILPSEAQEKDDAKHLESIELTKVPAPFDIRLIPRS